MKRWKEHFLFRDQVRIEGMDRQNLREKMKSEILSCKRGGMLIEGDVVASLILGNLGPILDG